MSEQSLRDCFICHASEDKDAIARPLAARLSGAGYDVWFDEFEMVVGDSLRERIDEGLASSRFGVVVLSRQFFEKGWPQSELNGLFAREMVGAERLILPVWHDVDEEFLASKSPLLADRIGVPSHPLDKAVEQVIRAIEHRRGRGASAAAIIAAQSPAPGPSLPEPVELVEDGTRVRLGLTDAERKAYKEEGGHHHGPGWLSVVAGPVRLERDLIDPTEISVEDIRGVKVDDQWYRGAPISAYLRVDHQGFYAKLPEEPGTAPAYWMRIWEDGLMEFGTDLGRKAGPLNNEPELVIPTTSVAELIHDYTLLFVQILRRVEYRGEAAAIVTFNNIDQHRLGVDQHRYWAGELNLRAKRLDGRPLRGPVDELPGQVGRWTKRTMDRLFLAAGISSGYPEINSDGQRLDRHGDPLG